MAKRRVIFHIGSTKTGSTALQAFLAQNAEALRAQGICYPNAQNADDPTAPIAGNLTANMQSKAARDKFEWHKKHELTEKFAWDVIREGLAVSECETVIFSGEIMSTRGAIPIVDIIKELRSTHRIDVFGFVRDPYSHIVSMWKQEVKIGQVQCDLPEWMMSAPGQEYLHPLRHSLRFQRVADVFTVAKYECHKADVTAAFFQKLGLDVDWSRLRAPSTQQRNPSITFSQAKLLCLVAKRITTRPVHAYVCKHFSELLLRDGTRAEATPIISEVTRFLSEERAEDIAQINRFLPEGEQLTIEQGDAVSYADVPIDPRDVAEMLDLISGMFDKPVQAPKPQVKGLPADFDPEAYLAMNPDVKAAGVDPVMHYLKFGRYERRVYR